MTITHPHDDFDLEFRIGRRDLVKRTPGAKLLECAESGDGPTAGDQGGGGGGGGGTGGDPGFTGDVCTLEVTDFTCQGPGPGSCGADPPRGTELCETDAPGCHHLTDGPPQVSSGTDVFFLKDLNVGSGKVEVHSATGASNYGSGQHSVTYFNPADGANGVFQMVGPDVWFLKGANVGSGKVELHSATAASNYGNGAHIVTYFDPADGANGVFQMFGPDLWFVKVKNVGSGKVELHSATAASNYGNGAHFVTYFDPAEQANGVFHMFGPDLYFVKVSNTGSGEVELHSATAASNYGSGQHSVTYFAILDKGNGRFQPGNA